MSVLLPVFVLWPSEARPLAERSEAYINNAERSEAPGAGKAQLYKYQNQCGL